MGKRRRFWLSALMVVSLAGLVWVLIPSGPPDPVYEGHPVSYWLRYPKSVMVASDAFADGFPSMDSNAVAFLVRVLETKDWPLHAEYVHIWASLPGKIADYLGRPLYAADVRRNAVRALRDMSENARAAIPALIRMLKEDHSFPLRGEAAGALAAIGKKDPRVENALVEALKDNDPYVRVWATHALGELGMKDSQMAAALIEAMKDPDGEVSDTATFALAKIDPEFAAKAGVK